MHTYAFDKRIGYFFRNKCNICIYFQLVVRTIEPSKRHTRVSAPRNGGYHNWFYSRISDCVRGCARCLFLNVTVMVLCSIQAKYVQTILHEGNAAINSSLKCPRRNTVNLYTFCDATRNLCDVLRETFSHAQSQKKQPQAFGIVCCIVFAPCKRTSSQKELKTNRLNRLRDLLRTFSIKIRFKGRFSPEKGGGLSINKAYVKPKYKGEV